jgi:hypothetical protein
MLERFSQYKSWKIGFRVLVGTEIFRSLLCPTSSESCAVSYLIGMGRFFSGLKRVKRKAAHSPLSIVEDLEIEVLHLRFPYVFTNVWLI